MSENKQFALIAAVIPHGESDLVVDATRAAGARGGTMIRARALGTEEASRFFHITIQPEKEVVFTIVPMSIKKAVMQSICSRILEKSGEHGIVLKSLCFCFLPAPFKNRAGIFMYGLHGQHHFLLPCAESGVKFV